MGTQGALAGVGDAVAAAHGVVDHGTGHDIPAVLQRGRAVLAAVQLQNKDSKGSATGSAPCKGAPAHPPCLSA